MRLALLLPALALSACAVTDEINVTRAYNYVAVTHLSEGGDNIDFEENTPGVGLGSEAPTTYRNVAVGLEAGVYRDPEDHWSAYGVGYAEYDLLAKSAPRRLRAGPFLGLSAYNELGDDLILDMVPWGGLQVTFATFGLHELRLRAAQGVGDSDTTLSLSSNFKF